MATPLTYETGSLAGDLAKAQALTTAQYSSSIPTATLPAPTIPAPSVVTSKPARTKTTTNLNNLNLAEAQLTPVQPTQPSVDPMAQVYSQRRDLQELYNPDGTAKNPNDPRVSGIPTLQDWATKYGVNEETLLKPVLGANPATNSLVTQINSIAKTTPLSPEDAGLLKQINSLSANELSGVADARNAATGGQYKNLNDYMTSIDSLRNERSELIKQLYGKLSSSEQELKYQNQLNDIENKERATQLSGQAGIADIEDKPIAMAFIRGQAASVMKQANLALQTLAIQKAPVIQQLQLASTVRQQAIEGIKLMLDSNATDTDMTFKMMDIFREIEAAKKAEEQAAKEFALEYNVEAPYYQVGDAVYKTGAGWVSEQQFFAENPQFQNDWANVPEGFIQKDLVTDQERMANQAFERGIFESDRGYDLDLAQFGFQQDQFGFQREQFEFEKDFKNRQLQMELEEIASKGGVITYDTNGTPTVELQGQELKDLAGADEVKKLKGYNEMMTAYQNYKNVLAKEGFALGGEGKLLLDQAYANLTIAWKNAAELGAITGPDLEILKKAIAPATGIRSSIFTTNSPQGIIKSIDAELAAIQAKAATQYNLLTSKDQRYKFTDFVNQLAQPFGIATPKVETNLDSLMDLQNDPNFIGPRFNSAGNASASNQVKGTRQAASPLPYLNMDGNPKTPNISLTQAYPQGSYGGQCGVWVRNIVEKQGLTYPRVGNSLAEKIATVKKYGTSIRNARPGSVLITSENKTNGHVTYILKTDSRGVYIAESNYGLDEKVGYGRFIPYNSPAIIGIINPTRA